MERKYQIFISSTFTDLQEERLKVVKQILDSYHFPIGMEMFVTRNKSQWEIIKRTIDSSDLFLLIIGYRYGAIDKSTNKSFTHMEFEYALESKKPIIVFLLEDQGFLNSIKKLENTIKNKNSSDSHKTMLAYLYEHYYDQDQTQSIFFRQYVSNNRLCKKFTRISKLNYKTIKLNKLDIQIDTFPSIQEEIDDLPKGGWIRQVDGISLLSLENRIIEENQDLFYSARSDNVEYARVLPNGQSLETETSFAKIIESSVESFWIYTTAFKQLYAHYESIADSLVRGVKYKILLADPQTLTEGGLNYLWVYDPDSQKSSEDKAKLIADMRSVLQRIRTLNEAAKTIPNGGYIEVRYYSKPLYFQMWLKDINNVSKGIGHFGIASYTGFKPHFRITAKTSRRLQSLLVSEFSKYWDDPTNKIEMW